MDVLELMPLYEDLNSPIEVLQLPNRIKFCLHRHNIRIVRQLAMLNKCGLSKIKGIGKCSIRSIIDATEKLFLNNIDLI